MDDRQGNFKEIPSKKFEEQMQTAKPMVFKQGEILEIQGSRFRIESINRKRMSLKLLPALKHQE